MSARRKKIVSILTVLAVLAATAVFGVWWFAFRKNPESVAKIEQINKTQDNLDEALGWDDPPTTPAAPADQKN